MAWITICAACETKNKVKKGMLTLFMLYTDMGQPLHEYWYSKHKD